MGNRINLVEIFGFPLTVNCPGCRKKIETNFQSYDVESSWTIKNGYFNLHLYCSICEDNDMPCEFEYTGNIELELIGITKIK